MTPLTTNCTEQEANLNYHGCSDQYDEHVQHTVTLSSDYEPWHGPVDSAIKWHGGKSYLAQWLIEHMPPHIHYVEPFGGGLSVLLRKDPQGVSEVVNDVDKELTNFWRVLKDDGHFNRFKRKVDANPFSEPEFNDAQPKEHDEQVDRAVKFFIRCRQSRQGLRKNFATLSKNRTRRGMNEQVSSWLTAVEGLPEVHERLKRVVILGGEDACKVIRQEDSKNTFFYLDPPYLHDTRVSTSDYQHEMSENDHRNLLAALSKIEGKFLLSGYRNDMYDTFSSVHGWRRVDKEIDCKASSAKVKPKRTESIWMNYGPNGERL